MSNLSEPKLIRTAATLYWERFRARLKTGPLWRLRFAGPSADRMLFSPSCLRPGDPLIARDIYQGRFTFSGRSVDCGTTSIFTIEPPSPAWQEGLHRFAWLRHLEKAGTELAAENARALIDDWIGECGKRVGHNAWAPHICAARLIAWLQHGRFILQNSEHGFYRRFMAQVSRHVRYLRSRALGLDETIELLHVRIALAFASVCLPSSGGVQARAATNLEVQLKRQILADGGHINRSPDALPDLLVNLIPLSQLYVAASKPVPPELLRAIDRMYPMLRFFRHSDGSMAQFHGAGTGRAELAAAVLRNDNTNGAVGSVAPQSGYHRLEANNCVVIADTGKPVLRANGAQNHASALAFELSAGRSRIVINAGVDHSQRSELDMAARSTAAHSTLTLDDRSSARFYTFLVGRMKQVRLLSGPSVVETQPWKTDSGQGFSARHDGYVKTTNLWHERGLLMADDGSRLSGYDRLTPDSASQPIDHRGDIRFHLHPLVKVERQDANTLLLRTDQGEAFIFRAIGASAGVEESIFFGDVSGPVYTSQIVLTCSYPAQDSVQWRFERQSS